MKYYINKLLNTESLSREETYILFEHFQSASCEQKSAVLTLLRIKKESVEELLGARDYLIDHMTLIESPWDIVDIVGTGGDGIGSLNISTLASLVVASTGVPVAKHGGRSTTSPFGSMDALSNLSLRPITTPQEVIKSLSLYRYAYLSAPLFNHVLKDHAQLRKSLGFPTIFNTLGPLLNPMQPKRQVIGVYRKDLLIKVAKVLQSIGSKHALIVHSHDGMDEISISAPTDVVELKGGRLFEYTISPLDFGLPLSELSEILADKNASNHSEMMRGILTGNVQGAKKNVVLLNSAAGLLVAGKVENLSEGIKLAENTITSQKALHLLNQLGR